MINQWSNYLMSGKKGGGKSSYWIMHNVSITHSTSRSNGYVRLKKGIVIHHPMLHSYNIPHGHPILKISRQRHSNILNDPSHKISSKTNNFWMYYSQIIFGCYVFPLSVTPMFYLYLIQKSFNKLYILEKCSSWF